MTRAPSRAKRMALARPIPVAAPVMRATFPASAPDPAETIVSPPLAHPGATWHYSPARDGGDAMVTALVNGVLIDGNGGAARPGSTVVVDGDSIAEVGQQRDFGSEVTVVDLGGKTIMPGLIDCHAHFAHWGMNLIAHQDKSLMLLAAETVAALRTTLEVGCTTARDLGGLDAGFREAVNRRADPRAAPPVQPDDHLAHQRHLRSEDSPGTDLAAAARHPQPVVQRPVRGARQGPRSAAAPARTSSRSPRPAGSARRRSTRDGSSSPAKRSRRSSTRPTWPASP